jgi:hypothetical protein
MLLACGSHDNVHHRDAKAPRACSDAEAGAPHGRTSININQNGVATTSDRVMLLPMLLPFGRSRQD